MDSDTILKIAGQILDRFKSAFSRDEWGRLSPDRRQLVEDVSVDGAKLLVRSLSGEDVSDARQAVTVALAHFGAIGAKRAGDVFEGILGEILSGAKTLISGL
ncbi:MAG: hypothetical protein ABID40_01695 [Candidatus Bipolaricaulota bacterium]